MTDALLKLDACIPNSCYLCAFVPMLNATKLLSHSARLQTCSWGTNWFSMAWWPLPQTSSWRAACTWRRLARRMPWNSSGTSLVRAAMEKRVFREKMLASCFMFYGGLKSRERQYSPRPDPPWCPVAVQSSLWCAYCRWRQCCRWCRCSSEPASSSADDARRAARRRQTTKMPWMDEFFGVVQPEPIYTPSQQHGMSSNETFPETMQTSSVISASWLVPSTLNTGRRAERYVSMEPRITAGAEHREEDEFILRATARMLYRCWKRLINRRPSRWPPRILRQAMEIFKNNPGLQKVISGYGGSGFHRLWLKPSSDHREVQVYMSTTRRAEPSLFILQGHLRPWECVLPQLMRTVNWTRIPFDAYSEIIRRRSMLEALLGMLEINPCPMLFQDGATLMLWGQVWKNQSSAWRRPWSTDDLWEYIGTGQKWGQPPKGPNSPGAGSVPLIVLSIAKPHQPTNVPPTHH